MLTAAMILGGVVLIFFVLVIVFAIQGDYGD